ncbi:hypothetical protein [Laribacter hongkongensis]|nr:hypothetical protein [Laribacter hongkongensis]MCG9078099.1 hypothetical protein [Laribacter hongkongensis]
MSIRGVVRPGQADKLLTQCLKESLALVDHIVVGSKATLSCVERGLR